MNAQKELTTVMQTQTARTHPCRLPVRVWLDTKGMEHLVKMVSLHTPRSFLNNTLIQVLRDSVRLEISGSQLAAGSDSWI